MVKYSSIKETENNSDHHENLGRELADRFNSGLDYVKNSSVYNLAKQCGSSLKNRAKFACSSLAEAVKESAQKVGIPTNRGYWKEHPWHAALTIGLAMASVGTAASDLYVLSDPNTYYFGFPKIPRSVSFIPPHRFTPVGPEIQISGRPLGIGDDLSLAAPFILFGLAAAVNVYEHGKWKKSIEKTEEESKQWS
jgi:hypothetical protein